MKVLHFKQQKNLEEVVVGFESTGPYAEPLVSFLAKKPARLVQVNPMHTKRLKELTGNSPPIRRTAKILGLLLMLFFWSCLDRDCTGWPGCRTAQTDPGAATSE